MTDIWMYKQTTSEPYTEWYRSWRQEIDNSVIDGIPSIVAYMERIREYESGLVTRDRDIPPVHIRMTELPAEDLQKAFYIQMYLTQILGNKVESIFNAPEPQDDVYVRYMASDYGDGRIVLTTPGATLKPIELPEGKGTKIKVINSLRYNGEYVTDLTLEGGFVLPAAFSTMDCCEVFILGIVDKAQLNPDQENNHLNCQQKP